MEEFRPEYYLVHDLSGKTILYGPIKKKHYQSGLAIPLGNDIDPAFALTLLKKGIYKDKETFQAQSFYGINEGYNLLYEESQSMLSQGMGGNTRVKIQGASLFGLIGDINGHSKEWNQYPLDHIEFQVFSEKDAPLFITIASRSSSQSWYYISDNSEVQEKNTIFLDASQFIPFNNSSTLEFSNKIEWLSIKFHLDIQNQATTLNRSWHVAGKSTTIYMPSEYPANRYNIETNSLDEEKERNVKYYGSYEAFPEYIEIPDWLYSSQIDGLELRLQTDDNWHFLKGNFTIENAANGQVSFWQTYSAIEEELVMNFPEIPATITKDIKCLSFDGSEELRGGYALISSKGNADLQQLSSPFQMEDIEWRLLNNTVEILQYIKRD